MAIDSTDRSPASSSTAPTGLTGLSPRPGAVASRRFRRTPEGGRAVQARNRALRTRPLYAWYYRWYNRWLSRVDAGWFTPREVPAPRIAGGCVVLDDPVERYLCDWEVALHQSDAYLRCLPLPTRRVQGRRLTLDEVTRVKAALRAPGVRRGDGTQARLAERLGVSLATICLIVRGRRHPDALHQSRLADQAEGVRP
jgi:hypothetical protein